MMPGYAGTIGRNDVFTKASLVDGKPTSIKCIDICGQTFEISGGPLSTVRLEDEWYEDVSDPTAVIRALKNSAGIKADLFCFWQRLPNLEPLYDYHRESEAIAVLPVSTYEHWFSKQIRYNTRGKVKKAKKLGVEVRETQFTDAFVHGMTEIFNETPVRQGRQFWHYGKTFEEVRSQFSRYLFREQLFGAYLGGELIGFMFLGHAGQFAMLGQIISKVKERDKAPNNALIAKAVEACADKGIPYLVYAYWPSPGSFADFKKQSGFEKVDLPRYYVPLSWKGELALRCGAHRGWRAMVPERLKEALKRRRQAWYERRAQ